MTTTTTETTLNSAQLAAVNSDHPRICVIATAGSGKTKVLIERIQRLVSDGHDPAKMVVLTFTQSAARELQDRLALTVGPRSASIPDWIETTGNAPIQLGFCGTLHSFCLRLLQEHGHLIGLPKKLTVLNDEQELSVLKQAMADCGYKGSVDRVRSALPSVTPTGVKGYPIPLPTLAAFRFVKHLRAHGLITYDLILSEARRLLARAPIVEKAEEFGEYSLGYSHIFVDEIQDASDADFQVYNALPVQNRFYVGDPKQAIFSFRGGNVGHIEALSTNPSWEIHHLRENYRSDRSICVTANQLIPEANIVSASEFSGDVVFYEPFQNSEAEKAEVAFLVSQHAKLEDCAILLRYRPHVNEWAAYLESQGIPVARKQKAERPKDWPLALAAIALLNDPENEWLKYGFLVLRNGERFAAQRQLEAKAAGRPMLVGYSPIEIGIPLSLYGEHLSASGLCSESIALVQSAIESLHPNATGAELLLALSEESEPEQTREGVAVTTIHGSKGKQWGAVFMPCFEDEIIPGHAEGCELDEAKRLAFVGITRAKHYLCITSAKERAQLYGRGEPQQMTPSRFIREMEGAR